MKKIKIATLLVLISGLFLIILSCFDATNDNDETTDTCDASYCGYIYLSGCHIEWYFDGYSSYTYTGYLDLIFNPAPPAGMTLQARLNLASIYGNGVTDGTDTLHIEYSGYSVACQLTNPSSWMITDVSHPSPVLADLPFNWETAGCAKNISEAKAELSNQ